MKSLDKEIICVKMNYAVVRTNNTFALIYDHCDKYEVHAFWSAGKCK